MEQIGLKDDAENGRLGGHTYSQLGGTRSGSAGHSAKMLDWFPRRKDKGNGLVKVVVLASRDLIGFRHEDKGKETRSYWLL